MEVRKSKENGDGKGRVASAKRIMWKGRGTVGESRKTVLIRR